MPVLLNRRQERFCQLVKQGIPPFRAYPLAGYKPDNGAPYRLSENVRVKRRLDELHKAMAMKARVTVESITDELNAVAQGAANDAQWSAAQAAIVAKAKLHGLLIDRKETGAPGDFANLQSAEEVLQALQSVVGADVAALVKAMLVAESNTGLAPGNAETLPGSACDAANADIIDISRSTSAELN